LTQDNPEEDILLKLSMAGKSLRMKPSDAPTMPEQQSSPLSPSPAPAQAPQPAPPVQSPSQLAARQQTVHQPQRETNTVVPPANTPPKTEAAQDDILRKLTMKPKDYTAATLTVAQVKEIRPPPGMYYQTPEEARSNKPYVSADPDIERVRKMAQNIIGSDMVQKRLRKK